MGLGNEIALHSLHLGYMTKMAATPIHGTNPLKIFLYGTKWQMALGLSILHWGHGSNEV